ncbi:MAG: thioredoxin [Nanoarchaeota archaeon]|jgi:thioredoxin 1|nr:thioredoxin [Nanoarchaeota archaeon]
MTEVPELTNGEFADYIREGIVLIDFFAEWCMPCMMMSPVVEDLSEELSGKAKFGKLNIDDAQCIANKYNVSSIPTFIVFKDGEPIEKVTGAMNQDDLSELVQKHLN